METCIADSGHRGRRAACDHYSGARDEGGDRASVALAALLVSAGFGLLTAFPAWIFGASALGVVLAYYGGGMALFVSLLVWYGLQEWGI